MSQYILSLSYGKDSLACLGAIEKLGWPLDRIVHAEIWATDTISADLPPMLEFKKKADAIIKERFGIEVEHVCAMRGGRRTPTSAGSMTCSQRASSPDQSKDSLSPGALGASTSNTGMKLTYEDIFYRRRTRPRKCRGGEIYGFPMQRGQWCNSELKRTALRLRGLPAGGASIAPENSRRDRWIPDINTPGKLVYGPQDQPFPAAPTHRGRVKILWCSTWASPLMSLYA